MLPFDSTYKVSKVIKFIETKYNDGYQELGPRGKDTELLFNGYSFRFAK